MTAKQLEEILLCCLVFQTLFVSYGVLAAYQALSVLLENEKLPKEFLQRYRGWEGADSLFCFFQSELIIIHTVESALSEYCISSGAS